MKWVGMAGLEGRAEALVPPLAANIDSEFLLMM